MTSGSMRWVKPIGLTAVVLVAIYLPALLFGRGGVAYWSPDNFERYAQSEYLIPLLDVPVYRSQRNHSRYELIDYLIAGGYWTPREVEKPRWIRMFRWNEQWRDGYHSLHREFTRGGTGWVDWTETHPDAAAELWPQVLQMIRTWPRGDYWAAELMAFSRNAESAEQVRQTVQQLERTRIALDDP